MINSFENVSSELKNGRQFAASFDDFVTKILTAIQTTMNSPAGQELVAPLLTDAIRSGMPVETWNKRKTDIMKTMFFLTLEECPQLKKEMARHLYNELRKEILP